MKIELDLSREIAHALNDLIAQGYRVEDNGNSGGVSRDHISAAHEWNLAYTKAMNNDEE